MLSLIAEEGDDEEEEGEEEEDQMLLGEDAMDFLSTDFGMDDGDDDDEEDGMGSKAMRHLALQHTEEVQYIAVHCITVHGRSTEDDHAECRQDKIAHDKADWGVV